MDEENAGKVSSETKNPPPNNSDTSNQEKLIVIKEGLAKIQLPATNNVFYNPVQQFNRDLTIAVIKLVLQLRRQEHSKKRPSNITSPGTDFLNPELYSDNLRCVEDDNEENQSVRKNTTEVKKTEKRSCESPLSCKKESQFRALDALSATGLRALRYALEIQELDEIVANDISSAAVESIKRHIKLNDVEDRVRVNKGDAGLTLYQSRYPLQERFQVIDLDPYGSPSQFFDAAVQAIDDGGLLCVTCTDMAGLCGNHGEASFAKYGGMPLHAKFCHEMALRLVLGSLERQAARYKRFIVPLVSLSADFYIRLFVLIYTSASEVKRSASKQSYVYHCNGCESFHLQPVGKKFEDGNRRKYSPGTGPLIGPCCAECNQKFSVGGAIWSESIHKRDFVNQLLKSVKEEVNCYETSSRIIGTLSLMSEELESSPLYYLPDRLANILHSRTPSLVKFKSALLNLGYQVSGSHANCNGVKTNAPSFVIWDIMRCWEKLHSVKREKLKMKSPGFSILSKEPKIEVSFQNHTNATADSQRSGLLRYPQNPEENWGPKARAKGTNKYSSLAEKRKRLQCKKGKRLEPLDLKRFPCKRFKAGVCDLGDNCRYTHENIPIVEKDNIKSDS